MYNAKHFHGCELLSGEECQVFMEEKHLETDSENQEEKRIGMGGEQKGIFFFGILELILELAKLEAGLFVLFSFSYFRYSL